MTDVLTHGAEHLPPVVFLHGAGANASMWHGCRSDRYRSIVPDLPGHGTRQGEGFGFDRTLEETVELVRGLDRPPVVVGLSLGGYVAIGVARECAVAGVVLSGSTAQYLGWGGLSTKLFGYVTRLIGGRLTARNEEAIRTIATPEIAEELIARGLSTRAAGDALVDIPGRDFHAMLEEITAPVLVLNGERDTTNRREEHAAAARCRAARIETIPDAGHACAISRPEAFRSHVEAFVEEVVPTR